MKFKVKQTGTGDFEIKKMEVIETTGTRRLLTVILTCMCAGFLVAAGFYSLTVGEFSSLRAVFEYTKEPLAMLLGYYFGANSRYG